MEVLVINCGSSSLKFQLIDSQKEHVLAKGLCERIGIDKSSITYQSDKCEKMTKEVDMPTHNEAINAVISALTDEKTGVINDMSEVKAVGHRVVHGGEYFSSSAIVDEDVLEKIEKCNYLAPLHNPANVIGIKACMKIMKDTPNVVVFDTAFHQTMPEEAYLYGIPREYYEKHKIRRYGFHGTSHSYVSKRVAQIMNKPVEELKTIVCHLGNGASICAVDGGKSVDTSMGLTPLAGVMMGTRSGDIDPGILEVLAKMENKDVSEITNILNKKSGVAGLSQVSSDFRDITKAIEEGDTVAKSALDAYIRTVVRFVGAYVAVMNGVDTIVFTAGVGENNSAVRAGVVKHLKYLGVELDEEANKIRGEEKLISTADSKVKVYVVPTNEELAIARETVELVK
ncbi:acetate/propionate family kinase [Eubacterium sp.]|jgi:acetate kinase|uniref:acetate/propionate family kinase n=1 Tax=Eubacterium sp. TaxID=142586 RepID=UPI001D8CE206|nr:acetate kinase [Eubacterium sp.]MBS5619468.1 acetate kinase [Eubacterium sp.]